MIKPPRQAASRFDEQAEDVGNGGPGRTCGREKGEAMRMSDFLFHVNTVPDFAEIHMKTTISWFFNPHEVSKSKIWNLIP